ncbi:protein kinase [Plantactinospora sp. B6F1]|uniref:protein kinase domain-containing protein n=1 Tax=Plantactinospora sp. B6F1 TaxID=3158971 RepID=UPI0032D8F452
MRPLERHDPRVIGQYRVLARIGAGGMALVYFGRSVGGRAVAVKVMHAEFAADPGYRARFRAEVAATRAAGGRYSPGLLDAAPDAPRPWMATQFLPALSLRDAVRRFGPLPPDPVWALAAGIAEALASVHAAGIVHLDLKPANVLLTADGPRVIDFGIAAATGAGLPAPGGTRAGSWGFLSPEQLAGTPVGPASDVFSFGATIAYACTGAPPGSTGLAGVPDDGLRELLAACLHPDPAVRPSLPELTGRLASTVRERPASATELPPAVTAEIDLRASEAQNPPLPLPPEPPVPPRMPDATVPPLPSDATVPLRPPDAPVPPRMPDATVPPRAPEVTSPGPRGGPDRQVPVRRLGRRALLLSAGVLAVVGATAGLLALLPDGSEPATTAPRPSTSPVPPLASTLAVRQTRTLEFYIFGRTTVKSLTTTVNGEAVTVRDVPLPYRRTVEIPAAPQQTSWQIDYHITTGNLNYVVLVDGFQYANGNVSTTGRETQKSADGKL